MTVQEARTQTHHHQPILPQLWSVHSAPPLTSFRRLKSTSVTNIGIYFASCWPPGLVLNRGGGTPKCREQTHPIASFCSMFPQTAPWSSAGGQLGCRGNAAALAEVYPGTLISTRKGHLGMDCTCSAYLLSQNSAAGRGNSAMDPETNFPELTDLNRAPAPFLYLGYE